MDTTCAADPAHATDAELVRDARQGDTAAFEALTARHFPMVYALAYARLGAREAAEDLAQEVFLLATLHLGALTDPARFAAWLGRIARNEGVSWLRRSQSASRLVRLVPLDDLPAEPAAPASQDARTALEADEETRALHEALFRLPEALREVVVLHYFEDLSKAEIAERLEVHPATVGRQIEKAVKAMKRTLEPILRRAAPAFRHSGKATARTTLLVGAVAAMSAPAKAALLAEAGASIAALAAAAGTTVGVVSTATGWHTILTRGFVMSAKSKVVAVLIALALIAGVSFHQMALTSPAPKEAAKPTVAVTQAPAPPSKNSTVSGPDSTATASAQDADVAAVLQAVRANAQQTPPYKLTVKSTAEGRYKGPLSKVYPPLDRSTAEGELQVRGKELDFVDHRWAVSDDGSKTRTHDARSLSLGGGTFVVYNAGDANGEGRNVAFWRADAEENYRRLWYSGFPSRSLGFGLAERPFFDVFAMKGSTVRRLPDETVDGGRCAVIEGHTPYGYCKAWLDIEKGYLPRKTVVEKKGKDLDLNDKPLDTVYQNPPEFDLPPEPKKLSYTEELVCTGAEIVEGYPFVMREKCSAHTSYDDGSEWTFEGEYEYSSIKVNPDFDAQGAFSLAFVPDGTRAVEMDIPDMPFEWRNGKLRPVPTVHAGIAADVGIAKPESAITTSGK